MPRAGGSAVRPLRPSPLSGLVENACLFGQGEFTGYSAGGLHRATATGICGLGKFPAEEEANNKASPRPETRS